MWHFIKKFLLFITLMAFFAPISFAATYPLPDPGNDLIGEEILVRTQKGDTLAKIGREHGVGLHEMAEANSHMMLGKLPAGLQVIVPTRFILPPGPREGIVVNLAELRLYHYPDGRDVVDTFPIAIGKRNWQTPDLNTKIVQKVKDPAWYVPKSIKEYTLRTRGKLLPDVMPPGPNNPLGAYALRLGKRSYLIHGTPSSWSVGRRASSGCMRMYAEDIEYLFYQVSIDTPVRIINQPNKVGKHDNMLFLESHKPLSDDTTHKGRDRYNSKMHEIVIEAAQSYPVSIDWDDAVEIADKKSGRPSLVGYTSE